MAVHVISLITIVLTVLYAGMIFFFRSGWAKLPLFHQKAGKPSTPVSVLIAARDEEERIGRTIRDLLKQNYPKELTEIIIVDDNSSDRTAEIIGSFAADGVRLMRLSDHEKLNSYKKKAITEAIGVSGGELIVATDADCYMGENWLSTVVSFYESGDYKLISSPVTFFEEKSAFEQMQTLEFLFLVGLGAAGISNGVPSTCNGANLAYRRDVFFELNGFKGIDDLASGDDELFLHKVAARYPQGIGFCKSPAAIVSTQAKATLKEFLQQRKRWASKSTRYKNKKIVALGISVWVFNVLMVTNFVGGFFNPVFWALSAGSFFVKTVAEFLFLYPVCTFTGRVSLLRFQPVVSFAHIFYLVYIGIAGNSGKYSWKGRMVR